MIKRADKRGISFDPPHLLVYFVVLSVVIVLVALAVPNIGKIGKSENIKEVEDFKAQIEEDLNPSLISGSVVKSYELPQGYDELCVVDASSVDSGDIVDKSKIQGSVVRGSLRNVFLFGDNKEVSFYVEDLALPSFPYYNCVETSEGEIELQLNNNGEDVVVKLPVNEKYCKNAEEKTLSDGRNLCNYLDSVYYQGYKGECCQEHGYCC